MLANTVIKFIIITITLVARGHTASSNISVSIAETCTPIPDLIIGNRTRELECCKVIVDNLYSKWTNQNVSISRSLQTLEAWNCPEFPVVCSNRTLGFTRFTSLMYDRFCNISNLLSECGNSVETAQVSPPTENRTWFSLVSGIKSSQLTLKQIEDPCIQVALYDAPGGGYENYYEPVVFVIPYCESAWCGYNTDVIGSLATNPWACLPTRCKANVAIFMATIITLSVIITIANFTVLLVYGSDKKTRHSQSIFRISLGVADLIVGALLFPSGAATLYTLFVPDFQFNKPFNVTGLAKSGIKNGSSLEEISSVVLHVLTTKRDTIDIFLPQSFVYAFGFITNLSLMVSVYLLTMSGVDRLQAITKPIKYNQEKAKRFATICSIVTWGVAIIESALPFFFVNGLSYGITGSGFVTLSGGYSLIVYGVGFVVPLILTWAISVAMFVQSKKSFKIRIAMSAIRRQNILHQRRLNRILGLMVTAFTLSVLPVILVLVIVSSVVSSAAPSDPFTYNSTMGAVTTSLELTGVLILMCNSLWNCMIYSIRNQTFRKAAYKRYRSLWAMVNPMRACKAMWKCQASCAKKINYTDSSSSCEQTRQSGTRRATRSSLLLSSSYAKTNGQILSQDTSDAIKKNADCQEMKSM